MTFRPLAPVKICRPTEISTNLGPRAELCLLPPDRLIVDESYQRPITEKGRQSILKILAEFSWPKFTPVVVVKAGGGQYAIIDGQHRATAALMHPEIDLVPCMVVEVDTATAARAFAAINGQVMGITKGQVFHALVGAGDPQALAVMKACEAADVTPVRHKQTGNTDSGTNWKAGETIAIGTLERCFKVYGHETLVTALQCVTRTADGNPGCLRSDVIRSLCEVLAGRHDWRDAGAALLDAFDEFSFLDLVDDTQSEARRRGVTGRQVAVERVRAHLDAHLGDKFKPRLLIACASSGKQKGKDNGTATGDGKPAARGSAPRRGPSGRASRARKEASKAA